MRIVTTPERIVLEEARRSFTWINEYDFGVDAVCINKIYPEEAMNGYFEGWQQMQRESLQLAAESFPGRRQFSLLLQDAEIRGIPALEKAGNELYEGDDPAQIYCREEAFRMEYDLKTGIRSLIISLPYADAEEIRTEKEGDDLILFVRNEVRRLRLPDILCRRDLDGQTFENGELTIRFGYPYQRKQN
jgi:arsenite-transporting ATPase